MKCKTQRHEPLCFAVVCIFFLIFVAISKSGEKAYQYDERQQLVQGKGFQYAFFSLLIYNAICILLITGFDNLIISNEDLIFFGIILGVFIYAAYCVWHDGYFSLNEKPKRVILSLAFCAVINFFAGILNLSQQGFIQNGVLTNHFISFSCAIMLLLLLLVIAIRYHRKKSEVE